MAYNGVLTLPSKRKSPSPAPLSPPPLELESIPSHGFFKLLTSLQLNKLLSQNKYQQMKKHKLNQKKQNELEYRV